MSPTTPIPPALSDAYAAARAICRHHAKSFFFASHFLPRPKRDHAYAVYAFCRLLDDAADEEASLASVEGFVDLLDAIYARSMGVSAMPSDSRHGRDAQATKNDRALDAFAHTVRACAIPKQLFLDLADGCRTDFSVVRYATWPDLERYCYLVAGVVGLIMCHVFDLREESARSQAVAMGNAMQLTNILRDVAEDADRGRVYLPASDLARVGLSDDDALSHRDSPAFRALVRFEIDRARSLFRAGAAGLCHLPDDGSRLCACVMACVYSGVLDAIEAQSLNVFAGRAHLTTIGKLRRLPLAWKLNRREFGEPLPTIW